MFAFTPGPTELLVVLAIAILLFGANKIPNLARAIGQSMGEFQKGREEIEKEIHEGHKQSTEENSSDGEPVDEENINE